MSSINDILKLAITERASDIHLTNSIKPVLRVQGVLKQLEEFEMNTPEILRGFVKELIDNPEELAIFDKEKCYDGSIQLGETRFRVHIFKQMKCDAIVLRLIPTKIPTFAEMNLPIVLRKFANLRHGLVLIVGTTGSGKSTTLATIIDEINRNYKKHIITVENPIEFVHEHKQSLINQREVGTDVEDFASAVRDAMREDPDILLLGELRDLETISNAITMAETGHLVFGTLHTRSVAETIDRIIDVFPPIQQEQVRVQLANSIEGIVSQELLPKIGGGRVPCCEIMFQTDSFRAQIREGAPKNSIDDTILMSSKKIGSQTKVQALAKLVAENMIEKEIAYDKLDSSEKESMNKMLIQYR